MDELNIFDLARRDLVEFNQVRKNSMGGRGMRVSFFDEFIKYNSRFTMYAKISGFEIESLLKATSKLSAMQLVVNNSEIIALNENRREIAFAIDKHSLQAEVAYAQTSNEILLLSSENRTNIQTQIDDLRNELHDTDWLDSKHKQRLLDKVNAFQKEFDKDIGSYYKSLGMLEDLGDSLGSFGKKAKPFGDLIKDVTSAFKFAKKQNEQIEKDPDPLQIPDMSGEDSDAP